MSLSQLISRIAIVGPWIESDQKACAGIFVPGSQEKQHHGTRSAEHHDEAHIKTGKKRHDNDGGNDDERGSFIGLSQNEPQRKYHNGHASHDKATPVNDAVNQVLLNQKCNHHNDGNLCKLRRLNGKASNGNPTRGSKCIGTCKRHKYQGQNRYRAAKQKRPCLAELTIIKYRKTYCKNRAYKRNYSLLGHKIEGIVAHIGIGHGGNR